MPDLDNKQIQGLQRILSLLDPDTLTKEEFKKNFKLIIDFVKKTDARMLKDFEGMESTLKSLANSINNNFDFKIGDARKTAVDSFNKEIGALGVNHKKMVEIIDKKISEVKDGKDGKNADEIKITDIITKKIPAFIINILTKDLPQLGSSFKESLEKLEGDERLDVSAIKGLEELLEEVSNKLGAKQTRVIGNSGTGGHENKKFNLSDQLDGSTRTFSLPSFWRILDIKLSSVPVMIEDEDYTVDYSAKTITFTSEITDNDIASGQKCLIQYSK